MGSSVGPRLGSGPDYSGCRRAALASRDQSATDRNHKLDGAQRESEKRVAAALHRRLYRGGTDKFP